jgi:hypothetical protein
MRNGASPSPATFVHMNWDLDWIAAEREFRAAIANPNHDCVSLVFRVPRGIGGLIEAVPPAEHVLAPRPGLGAATDEPGDRAASGRSDLDVTRVARPSSGNSIDPAFVRARTRFSVRSLDVADTKKLIASAHRRRCRTATQRW